MMAIAKLGVSIILINFIVISISAFGMKLSPSALPATSIHAKMRNAQTHIAAK